MEKQEILNIVSPIVGNYKMTAKISGNNQVIILDSKNRFAGWIDTDNKKVVAKYQGSKVLLGSIVRNALVQALNYNY